MINKMIYFFMGFGFCFALCHNSFIKPANSQASFIEVDLPIGLNDIYTACIEARDAARQCCVPTERRP